MSRMDFTGNAESYSPEPNPDVTIEDNQQNPMGGDTIENADNTAMEPNVDMPPIDAGAMDDTVTDNSQAEFAEPGDGAAAPPDVPDYTNIQWVDEYGVQHDADLTPEQMQEAVQSYKNPVVKQEQLDQLKYAETVTQHMTKSPMMRWYFEQLNAGRSQAEIDEMITNTVKQRIQEQQPAQNSQPNNQDPYNDQYGGYNPESYQQEQNSQPKLDPNVQALQEQVAALAQQLQNQQQAAQQMTQKKSVADSNQQLLQEAIKNYGWDPAKLTEAQSHKIEQKFLQYYPKQTNDYSSLRFNQNQMKGVVNAALGKYQDKTVADTDDIIKNGSAPSIMPGGQSATTAAPNPPKSRSAGYDPKERSKNIAALFND